MKQELVAVRAALEAAIDLLDEVIEDGDEELKTLSWMLSELTERIGT